MSVTPASSFGRRPVRTRLPFGFLFMIALLMLVVWQGWQGFGAIGRKADEVGSCGAVATEISRVVTYFGHARVAVSDYLWDGTPAMAERSLA